LAMASVLQGVLPAFTIAYWRRLKKIWSRACMVPPPEEATDANPLDTEDITDPVYNCLNWRDRHWLKVMQITFLSFLLVLVAGGCFCISPIEGSYFNMRSTVWHALSMSAGLMALTFAVCGLIFLLVFRKWRHTPIFI
jgi:hypothetical protein